MKTDEQQRLNSQKKPEIDMGLALALCITFGSGIGAIFDNFSLGMMIGMSVGMIFSLISARQQNKRQANIGLAIMLAGLGIAFVIWYAT